MLFRIDASNGLAIYDQISRQMKFAIAHGAVRSGELIPSVRELANQLAVNPNTVARAYRDLQVEGVVEPLRGEGLRVTKSALELCRRDRQSLLRTRLRGAIAECRSGGLTTPEIRVLIDEVLQDTAEMASTA
ncbi:MAG: GntR family transcriptional regulator [Planctomycetales bacterium 12-60-4]|nr:MAG: GntR family transcriptional regulator [Planctomycetales bacterium 12-60-4]